MRSAALAMLVTLAATVTACGEGTHADKAGGPSPPAVLKLADGYNPGLELEPGVAYFVKRVRQLSKGALRINVVENWAGNRPGFEQDVVRDVAAGKADLAWVGTRVFDTLGVRSFQALTAPMLIDSYALERAVITSDMPPRMMRALNKLGVTGLGVLAGGLRKPIALRRPLLRPADWHGTRFSVIRSRSQIAAIRALGARTTDIWGPARQDAVGRGSVDGFEMNYYLWSLVIDPSVVPYVAANVNLWPETIALLANPHRLSGLSKSQQGWLRRAAADAAVHSTGVFQHEARLVRSLCKQGARFRDASATDIAAMRRAFTPVYGTLERDGETRQFIRRIQDMKRRTPRELPAAAPPGCAVAPPSTTAAVEATTDPSILDGVYRVSWSDHELAAIGHTAAFSRPSFGGLITLTLRAGHYTFQPRTPPKCTGTYTVSGATVRFRFQAATYCQGVVVARWRQRAGELRLHIVSSTNPYDRVFWGLKPWRKIA